MSFDGRKSLRFLEFVGPAFLISMGALDPGNISGDVAVGQKAEYRLIWVLIVAAGLYYWYQSLCIQLGVYARKDIATLCKDTYSKKWNGFLWAMCEVALLAADTQEVLGSAIALQILFGFPPIVGIIASLIIAFAILHMQNKNQQKFEMFFGVCILVMAICFGINFLRTSHPLGEILQGFIPTVRIKDLPYAISLMGSILMPQNLFLHSALVLTRDIPQDIESKKQAVRFFRLETLITVIVSSFINFFIIGTFDYFSDIEDLIQLKDVGNILAKNFGGIAVVVWGLGLFSSGQSATIAGALTGQYIMEGFLSLRINRELRILLSRAISLVPCIIIFHFADVGIIYILLNVVQFIQLPFVLIPLFRFVEDKSIVPELNLCPKNLNILKIISAGFVLMNIGQLISVVPFEFWSIVFIIVFLIGYVVVLLKLFEAKKNSSEADQLSVEMV